MMQMHHSSANVRAKQSWSEEVVRPSLTEPPFIKHDDRRFEIDTAKTDLKTYGSSTLQTNEDKAVFPSHVPGPDVEIQVDTERDDEEMQQHPCMNGTITSFIQGALQAFSWKPKSSPVLDSVSVDEIEPGKGRHPLERLYQKSLEFFKNGNENNDDRWRRAFVTLPNSKLRFVQSQGALDIVRNRTTEVLETIDENSEVQTGLPTSGSRSRVHLRSFSRNRTLLPHVLHQQQKDDLMLQVLKKRLLLNQKRYGLFTPANAMVYNRIGTFHFHRKQFELAKCAYKNATLCQKGVNNLKECAPITTALENLATVYTILGDDEKSSTCLERSLTLHISIAKEQKKDPRQSILVGNCLYQVGLNQSKRGQHKKALATLQLCLEIREPLLKKNHVDVARTFDAMGKAHRGLDDLDRAAECHMDALEIKQRSGVPRSDSGFLLSLQNLAEVHEARNAPIVAMHVYQKIVKRQKRDLDRLRRVKGRNAPEVKLMEYETGKTLLKVKYLNVLIGRKAEARKKGKEAAICF